MESLSQIEQRNTRLFDQERDCIEERSHYESGYVVVRRENTTRENWERFPYRRIVTQWDRRS